MEEELTQWKGINFSMHHFGGLQINYQKNELGHIHGNGLLDVYVGSERKNYFIQNLHCEDHHILDKSNSWVSFWIKREEDYNKAINILAEVYRNRM